MEKDCCDVKVTEIENGYRFEITGEEIKDKCKSIMGKCCTDSKSWKEFFKNCCPSNS